MLWKHCSYQLNVVLPSSCSVKLTLENNFWHQSLLFAEAGIKVKNNGPEASYCVFVTSSFANGKKKKLSGSINQEELSFNFITFTMLWCIATVTTSSAVSFEPYLHLRDRLGAQMFLCARLGICHQ